MSAVVSLTWTGRPTPDQTAQALALLAAAGSVDGVYPVSEPVLLRLRHQRPGDHLLAQDSDGTLVGYSALDTRTNRATAELAVHPDHRRRGTGGALASVLVKRVGAGLWVWSHGEHPGALALAKRHGMRRARELWQLRRSLDEPPSHHPMPVGLHLRTFIPGRDEAAVVEVNNRAFAWHPEQADWDVEQLAVREDEPWFDPSGFLLAVDGEDRLLGFHWTKVHADGVGEVYVLGIDPDGQGSGLGSALLAAGLEHLAGRGLGEVLLYVESDNDAAVRMYEKIGFRHHHTDVAFLYQDCPHKSLEPLKPGESNEEVPLETNG